MAENALNKYLQMDSKGRWIVAFGKYKGNFLDDVISEDPQYIEWFLEQDDVPRTVRETIEARS